MLEGILWKAHALRRVSGAGTLPRGAGSVRAVNLTSPLRPVLDVPRLLRHGRGTREQIVAFQERRLRELVHHAYERVPYYHRLFDDARIKPADIRTIADLHLIPITTKETLRALARDERLARGVNRSRLIKHESNGSTGIPMTVFRQRSESIALAAVHRRARSEEHTSELQ